jgi:thymidylate synthase ThyX
MKMNLREALHMIELRSMPQGHPDYRFICQEMWRRIQEVHPALAECGDFIDWEDCSPKCGRSLRSRRWKTKGKLNGADV